MQGVLGELLDHVAGHAELLEAGPEAGQLRDRGQLVVAEVQPPHPAQPRHAGLAQLHQHVVRQVHLRIKTLLQTDF